MKTYLETNRVILRYMEPTEASLLFDLDSDPEVMKYLNGGKPSEMQESEEYIIRMCDYYEKYGPHFGYWFAIEKESQKVMGWFLLRPDKKEPNIKNPELGYRLKKEFWGKGYATEVSLALVKKAFLELNCDSVFAIAIKANSASQNVMKKVGMKFVKDYIEDHGCGPGGDHRAVYYIISKETWNENQLKD